MEEIEYVEMYVDDMKAAKNGWQSWLRVAKRKLKQVQSIEVTLANRWELKSLEMSYNFFIDQMRKITSVYGELIDLAENCELDEEEFQSAMKVLKQLNNDLSKEYHKKSFSALNNKYIEGIKIAPVIEM